jgi:hypothetical protein
MAPGTAVGPSWLFGQAQFTAPGQLQVSAVDGTTYWLTVDLQSRNVTRSWTAVPPRLTPPPTRTADSHGVSPLAATRSGVDGLL